MKLVIGLGNPGKKYEGTRHNVGFAVLELLAKRWGCGPSTTRFQSLCEEARRPDKSGVDEQTLLLRPQTFMNLSGASVLAARDFYKVPHEKILVLCDDFALPLGKLRLRPKGSAGGQKGLADIIKRLGTEEIPRLRLGVGPLPEGWNAADFVLGRFAAGEKTEIEITTQFAADAVELWLKSDLTTTMTKFN
ncbi:MAG: aminoacyl-tRNA hydrolase [Pirellulales bacterium]